MLGPACVGPGAGSARTCTTRVRVPARRPRRVVVVKPADVVSRWRRSSTARHRWHPGVAQTASLLRPLRRRADRMDRPARVRIRRRNPCTLWRRRLFGWYVRLLTADLRRYDGWCGSVERTVRAPWGRAAQAAPVDTGSTVQRYAGATGGSNQRPVDNRLPTG